MASRSLYGGTFTQFDVTLRRMGINVTFVDISDHGAVKDAITPKTKALYGETIGNPAADILDISAIADIAHDNGIPLIVDNTFATPYLCRPIEHGADIVVHSATKFIGGHGVAIAGVIVESGLFPYDNGNFPGITEPSPAYHDLMFWENFREYAFLMKARVESLRDIGAALSPFNSFVLLLGLETLSLRMARHTENARRVAEFLSEHPDVAWVRYPIFPNNPWTDLANKYVPEGPGAVFTFGVKGGFDQAAEFIARVELASHLANVGDAKTLVIHPASTTHQQVPVEERRAAGVGDEMIRISVGLGGHRRHPLGPGSGAGRGRGMTTVLHEASALERLQIIQSARTVALVGVSANILRSSNFVATYLVRTDLEMYPVNPMYDEILGLKSYPSLADLPVVPDIVDVFRRHDELPNVVDEAIADRGQGGLVPAGAPTRRGCRQGQRRRAPGGPGSLSQDRACPILGQSASGRLQHRCDLVPTAEADLGQARPWCRAASTKVVTRPMSSGEPALPSALSDEPTMTESATSTS